MLVFKGKTVSTVAIIDKLKNFIFKDTRQANESKKMAVLIRVLSLYLVSFFIGAIFFYAYLNVPQAIVWSIVFVALYIAVFIAAYYLPKVPLVWCFIVVTAYWGIMTLKLFGWASGANAFPLVLVMIYFFSSYEKLYRKIFFGFFLGMGYYIYSSRYYQVSPVIALTIKELSIVRGASMMALIIAVSVISYVFSRETQSLEGKLSDYNKQLEKKANTDALTGLYNRGKGMEILSKLQKEAKEKIFSICICDIDFFKKVNDNYGHDIGDEVLKGVARALENTVGRAGFVSRWGGEEFFIIFPDCNGDDAFMHVERIRKYMRKMSVYAGEKEVKVNLTYGLSEYNPEKSVDDNVKEADEKLYYGKEHGRDQIVY